MSTLAFALVGADGKIKKRVFKNMSKRAASLTQSEIDRLSAMDSKQMIIEIHRALINSAIQEIK